VDRFDGPNVLGLTSCRRDVVAASGVLRGVGLVFEGRLAEARESLLAALVGAHAFWQVSALGALGLLEAWSGRLSIGEQHAFRALATAEELDLGRATMTTSAFLAIATIARERDDLDRARAFLEEAAHRCGAGSSRLVAGAITVEQALLIAASGDVPAALELLAGLPDTDHPSMPTAVTVRRRTILAWLLVQSRDLDAAERALAGGPRADTAEIAALRMRIAIERGDLATARLVSAAWPAEPTPRADVEQHLWTAILEHDAGDERAARDEMATAIRVAEPDHDLGPFRFAGAHVLGPARALYRSTPTPFLREIVEQPAPPPDVRVSSALVEQLTHREYLVLSLLPTRLSNAEIAERLDVSLNTVKTHLKHIYRKLDVPGRREAVGSAEQLRLL
jgi:LuxR family maltose regulon positive regulatory protein